MNKDGLLGWVVSILAEQGEKSGYDIYRQPSMNGSKIQSNYLYMILNKVKEDGNNLKIPLKNSMVVRVNGPNGVRELSLIVDFNSE